MKKLKLAIPKGSLQESTISLFTNAGFEVSSISRSYYLSFDDPEIDAVLIRAQEIPRYVQIGIFDAGISGKDWITENRADVKDICELCYAKHGLRPVKIVLAVPEKSEIKSVKDLNGKIIATELVNLTKDYLKRNNVQCDVEFSWGATEIKAGHLVDAIVEITETGTTISSHGLKIIEVIMESTPHFFANNNAWKNPWKREKIMKISLLLESALNASKKVGLKMNVQKKDITVILKRLPAIKKPTISRLSTKNWYAVETIIDKKEAKEIIPELKKLGASGIVEYNINKLVY
ncbi:MAG: ATP phosphoribosyltransferase [candidate division TA06 bacterium ADurb.Bin131]|uniref:ATP phosphoribosyltransferase n=1 Tax=candidate division TA06 bacterium ADurb.Bin131 TaxID=1852827 RepID=A0A1V6CE05_UNCT6|nr:MAG: ATP phosphoribosyltransferase [candidate division TA06 bacterium ADurb.Bin131]